MRQLRQLHRHYLTDIRYYQSVYFLKGNDRRNLNLFQQGEIARMITKNTLQTSCLVFNPVEAQRKLESWYKSLYWITPHYAIKANPSSELVQQLTARGSGLDCASRSEIEVALMHGVPIGKIVYSNPVKDEGDLVWAHENGIRLTTADSVDELIKIQKHAPGMSILWRIAIKEE